ncbi:MAG: exodeoxyribonuclease VII large subunit [Verrucomicrobiota bacterium]
MNSPDSQALSVTQLTRQIRDLLEIEIAEIWVEGEISNYRAQASGHQYFTLKDETAQLACVLFRGQKRFAEVELANGVEVQLLGEVSVYEARGQYQLIVKQAVGRGKGALQARFEALKNRLAEEGLFENERKKALPRFPRTLGLVTSPSSAAIQDMIQILGRRAPWVRLLLFPVRVQGKGAEAEIAAAIRQANQGSGRDFPAIDTLLVGRGGGSLEDLWNFNEEEVARAIAESDLPVISAVGHEIDFTIADFAADLRAPTPSAAAELAVPNAEDLRASLRAFRQSLRGAVGSRLDSATAQWQLQASRLAQRSPKQQIREWTQRLDFAGEALRRTQGQLFERSLRQLAELRLRLSRRQPAREIRQKQEQLGEIRGRLRRSSRQQREQKNQRLHTLRALLTASSPESILKRGFSLTLDKDGHFLRSARQVKKGQRLRTRLAEGEVESEVCSSQLPE